MSRLSCVQQLFVRLCPDFCVFIKLSCDNVQTFVRSTATCTFMSRLLRVHQTFMCLCPDFWAIIRVLCVHVQTLVRSTHFCAFTSFSCFYIETFLRSPDFRACISRLRAIAKILSIYVLFLRSTAICAFTSRFLCIHQTFV